MTEKKELIKQTNNWIEQLNNWTTGQLNNWLTERTIDKNGQLND